MESIFPYYLKLLGDIFKKMHSIPSFDYVRICLYFPICGHLNYSKIFTAINVLVYKSL